MIVVAAVFWITLGLLVWTHAGYPATAFVLARMRRRTVRPDGYQPTVSVVVPAHDEETVIERRLENLRGLHYPAEKLELIVTSD
ncbi:MAG TPA: hypothetical protein VKP14_09095 [Gaiellaceae bacterium]|nr:hypothetical protein [Gaiellaceae bacterium]